MALFDGDYVQIMGNGFYLRFNFDLSQKGRNLSPFHSEAEIKNSYSINACDMANSATYRRHQKYLKQFRPFIKSFTIDGADPEKVFFVKTRIGPFGPRPTNRLEIRASDVVQRFFSVLNMATTALESGTIKLKQISLQNFGELLLAFFY